MEYPKTLTVELDMETLLRLEELAALKGQSLDQLVDALLRSSLTERERERERERES